MKRMLFSVFLGLALTAGATCAQAVSVGGSLNFSTPGLGVGISIGDGYYGGSEIYAAPSIPVIVAPAPVYHVAPPPPRPHYRMAPPPHWGPRPHHLRPHSPRPHGPAMRPHGPGPRHHRAAMRPHGHRPHRP